MPPKKRVASGFVILRYGSADPEHYLKPNGVIPMHCKN